MQPHVKNASAVKALWLLGQAAGTAGIAVLYFMDFKPPEF
jgi:hypothetical protein